MYILSVLYTYTMQATQNKVITLVSLWFCNGKCFLLWIIHIQIQYSLENDGSRPREPRVLKRYQIFFFCFCVSATFVSTYGFCV